MNQNVAQMNKKIEYLEELIEITLIEQNITKEDQKFIETR